MYGIIGGSIGAGIVIIIAVMMAYLYRKKMNDNMKGAEKKLYGFIQSDEIVFGRLLGSGSFGEVRRYT